MNQDIPSIPQNLDLLDQLSPDELNRLIIQEVLKGTWDLGVHKIQSLKPPDLLLIQACLDAGAPVNAQDHAGWTYLHLYATHGHLHVVKLLIASQAYLDAQTSSGWTALHQTAWYNHLEIVKTLITAGASIDAKDHRGHTALHLAASKGHLDCTKALLRAKASLDLKNSWGNTPWDLAKHTIRTQCPELQP